MNPKQKSTLYKEFVRYTTWGNGTVTRKARSRLGTSVIHIKTAPTGWRTNPEYIYIGRPGPWGNPFKIGVDGSRDDRSWLRVQPVLRELIYENLRGKILVCYCHPQPCHGDVLKEIADA